MSIRPIPSATVAALQQNGYIILSNEQMEDLAVRIAEMNRPVPRQQQQAVQEPEFEISGEPPFAQDPASQISISTAATTQKKRLNASATPFSSAATNAAAPSKDFLINQATLPKAKYVGLGVQQKKDLGSDHESEPDLTATAERVKAGSTFTKRWLMQKVICLMC